VILRSLTEAEYSRLSRIAPTVAAPEGFVPFGVPRKGQATLLGRALSKEGETTLDVVSSSSRRLLFVDHDDLLEPEALATKVRYLEQRPAVGMVCCDWHCIDKYDRFMPVNASAIPQRTPDRVGLRVLRDDEPETPFATLLSCFRDVPTASMYRLGMLSCAGPTLILSGGFTGRRGTEAVPLDQTGAHERSRT
jgi:hypothetical protein